MSRQHNTGEMGLKLVVFDSGMDPHAWPPAEKYIGQTNTFSLVWTDREAGEVALYVHDEFTQGGVQIASSGAPASGPSSVYMQVFPTDAEAVAFSAQGPSFFAISSETNTLFNNGAAVLQGGGGGEPPVQSAPVITRQPTLSPSNPGEGDEVVIDWGAAYGVPSPTQNRVFLMDGSDATGQLVGNSFVAQQGLYEISGAWDNAAGSTAVTPVYFTVDPAAPPAINYDTDAFIYLNADCPITGTDEDVLTVALRGTLNATYTKTGTGNVITRSADGFTFADGAYFQTQIFSNLPTTDGLFAVVSFTLTSYGSNIGAILDGAGGHLKIRNNAGNLQFLAQGSTGQAMALGAAPYGTRVTVAGEIDDVTDIMRAFNVAGNLDTNPTAHPGMTDPTLTRVMQGRYVNGTLHEFGLFVKGEGQAWTQTMEAVFADFTRGA